MPTIVYCYHLPSENQPTPPLVWDAFELSGETSGEPRRVGIVPKILNTTDEREIFRSVANVLNEVIAVQVLDDGLTDAERASVIANAQIMPRTFIGDDFRPRDNWKTFTSTCVAQDLEFQVNYDKVVTPYDVARTRRRFVHKCMDRVHMHAVDERIEARKRNREAMPSERGSSLPFLPPAAKTPSITPITPGLFAYFVQKHQMQEAYSGPLQALEVIGDPYAATRPVPPPAPPPPPRPPVARVPAHAEAEQPTRRWRADIDG